MADKQKQRFVWKQGDVVVKPPVQPPKPKPKP